MTKYSDVTGLPELPEGYFFRISDFRVEIRRREEGRWLEYDGREYLYFRGTYIPKRDLEIREVEKEVPGFLWFTKKEIGYEAREKNQSQLVVSEPTEETGQVREYRNSYGRWEKYPVRALISREMVKPLAEKCYARFQDLQDLENLRGDYPPKTFKEEA